MASDLIGHALGPYVIDELISHDGIIETYKGHHSQLDQTVLIQIIGRELESDPVLTTRFRREAKAIATLRHPNIAQVHDSGQVGSGHYIISDYLDGMTLASLLDEVRAGRRRLEPDDITFIIRQIAAALDYAHSKGVFHRAVCPVNIMLTRAGQAILTGFGTALLLEHPSATAESPYTAAPPGMEYMAPEQMSDPRAASAASDIYSLGVVLYEIVTGELPFESDSAVDAALRSLNETAPDPRYLNPDLPEPVVQVILKALARSPKDRFRNAMQMAVALEHAFTHPDRPLALEKRRVIATTEETQPAMPTTRLSPVERIPATRTRLTREERRERDRLRAEHRRIQQQQRKAKREAARQARRARRQAFWARWGRTILVLAIVFLLLGALGYLLQTLGVIAVDVRLPTLPPPPTQAPTQIAGGQPASTPTATLPPTDVPTSTPAPTATPLQPASATPIPPLQLAPLTVGTSAIRLYDGGVMQFVPAGTFLMGTNDARRNPADRPQHTVMLSDYWIDRTEVTNAQYALCVSDGLCQPPSDRRYFDNPVYARYPVMFVRYESAVAYCLWLAGQSGQPIGLPTEAQWEKAAAWDPVSQTARLYPWGDTPPNPDLLRYNESLTDRPAAPVGSYPAGASAYGVLDMAGNVWEWVADWYDADYYKRTGISVDPLGPLSGNYRITRGGAWTREGRLAISSIRNPTQPTASSNEIGFRCAMNAARPPFESGVLLTPLDATRALQTWLTEARNDPANDTPTLDEWLAALDQISQALQANNNPTALSLVGQRLERLQAQQSTGLISSRLALQLEGALRWMQEQLTPPEE